MRTGNVTGYFYLERKNPHHTFLEVYCRLEYANMLTKTDAFEAIAPLRDKYGVKCSLEQFHEAVNLAFHKHESEIYDDIHKVMWDSLPQQFDLLVRDALHAVKLPDGALRMLDIGCGTGLASDSMLRTPLAPRIASIALLDVSAEMLAKAVRRSKSWSVSVEPFRGLLEDISQEPAYPVVVTCSVLHHIPDLADFLTRVARLQPAGGIFIHLQDPNGDFLHDPEFLRRREEFWRGETAISGQLRRFMPSRIIARLKRLSNSLTPNYLKLTNRDLLASGIIARPMVPADIWAIIDLHDNNDTGVSIEQMKTLLPDTISSQVALTHSMGNLTPASHLRA